jgi:hypothetical protein
MRVVGFIVLVGVIGVAVGLLSHRILIGVLVAAGVLVLGLLMLINRADPPAAERTDSRRE